MTAGRRAPVERSERVHSPWLSSEHAFGDAT